MAFLFFSLYQINKYFRGLSSGKISMPGVTLTSAAQIDASYMEASPVPRWKTVDLAEVCRGDPLVDRYVGDLTMYFKDGWEVARHLFCATPSAELITKYETVYKGGEEAWAELNTAKWWKMWDGRLPKGATLMPWIAMSDKVQVAKQGNRHLWPVTLQSGNQRSAYRRLDKNVREVAQIPILTSRAFNGSKDEFR
jgi:hypothetical protein